MAPAHIFNRCDNISDTVPRRSVGGVGTSRRFVSGLGAGRAADNTIRYIVLGFIIIYTCYIDQEKILIIGNNARNWNRRLYTRYYSIYSGGSSLALCAPSPSVLDWTRCSHVIESFAYTRNPHTRITMYNVCSQLGNRIRQQSVTYLFEIYIVYIILDSRACSSNNIWWWRAPQPASA